MSERQRAGESPAIAQHKRSFYINSNEETRLSSDVVDSPYLKKEDALKAIGKVLAKRDYPILTYNSSKVNQLLRQSYKEEGGKWSSVFGKQRIIDSDSTVNNATDNVTYTGREYGLDSFCLTERGHDSLIGISGTFAPIEEVAKVTNKIGIPVILLHTKDNDITDAHDVTLQEKKQSNRTNGHVSVPGKGTMTTLEFIVEAAPSLFNNRIIFVNNGDELERKLIEENKRRRQEYPNSRL